MKHFSLFKIKEIFMRRICFIVIFFGLSTLCFSQNTDRATSGAQKLFFSFNVLYDYEKFSFTDSIFFITSNNTLFEIALGYDFGRFVPRIYLDMGVPSNGTIGFISNINLKENIKESLTGYMDTKNLKFGLEAGIKPVYTKKFDLIIPFGMLFCGTTYTQKNPSYTSNNNPYDRIWDYSYINLFSGINATIQLNNHFKIGLFSRFGIPVKKECEYKEVLRGNDYIWKSTNSKTYSIKNEMNVSTFSIGIGILANF